MLRTFRKGAHGFLAKLLLLVLIASFALWGVGDMVRGPSGIVVANVDGEPIFRYEIEERLRMQQRSMPELTQEVMNSLPVRLQMLNMMVNQRLINIEAEALGLDFSDEMLGKHIVQNKDLADETGRFNPENLKRLLRQNNISEQIFLQNYESDIKVDMLLSAIRSATIAPDALAKLMYAIYGEKRKITLALHQPEDTEQIAQPAPEVLAAYYADQQERYRKPEYRRFSYIVFDRQDITESFSLKPTDEEISAYYENNRAAFDRDIVQLNLMQLSFDSENAAKAAYNKLQDDSNEAAIRKYAAQTPAVQNADALDIGQFEAGDFPAESDVTDQVFALPKHALSTPINTGLGWSLFFVKNRKEGQTSLEDVKNDIRQILLDQAIEEKAAEISDTLDDAIAAGSTLKEALQQTGLGGVSVMQSGPLTQEGYRPNAEEQELTTVLREILAIAFEQEAQTISPVTLVGNHSDHYVLVETLEVQPSTIPPLDAVREQVQNEWIEGQRYIRLMNEARAIATELQQADNPLTAAKERGLTLVELQPRTRGDIILTEADGLKADRLPEAMMNNIFSLPANGVTGAYTLSSGAVAIALLRDIQPPPPPNDAQLEQVKQELRLSLQDQITTAYIDGLRTKYQVEIFADRLVGETSR